MRPRAGLAAGSTAVALSLVGAFGAAPAAAHQSPANCTSNSLDMTISRDRGVVRPGERVTYTLVAANVAGLACDLTDVRFVLVLPAADGSATGREVAFQPEPSFPAGTAAKVIGQVEHLVEVNAGVTDAVAEARSSGILHDAPAEHGFNIRKDLGTDVTQPILTLRETATPSSGPAPLQVTFTYTVTNDSTTPAPISNVNVSDDRCPTPMYQGGDANGNGLLDNGETWTYACTTRFPTPGPFTSTATATGTNTVDARTVTSPPATAQVTVTAPSGRDTPDTPGGDDGPGTDDSPSVAEVLGKSLASPNSRQARRDAPCIAVPAQLRVRARERTTVRVRVSEEGERIETALVRIIGPGIRRRKVTNQNGVAIFRVRARRSGTLVIQSDRCIGADRVSVLRARQVTNDQVPRGTG
jgi:hypothetical protein